MQDIPTASLDGPIGKNESSKLPGSDKKSVNFNKLNKNKNQFISTK